MKVTELVQAASASNAHVFKKVDPKMATAIAAALLRELGEQIDLVEDGRLAIAGLGSFVIKMTDGATAGTTQKRVLLRRPK